MATNTGRINGANVSSEALLVSQVTGYVKDFMSHYDGSHDYHHIQRVHGLALAIAASSSTRPCDMHIVTLAALLHDVGDRKYLKPGDDPETMVKAVLLSFGADAALAGKVQTIVNAVSYTHEILNAELVQRLVLEHPELGAVQDADRLDALGAIGIGRLFTYGGASRGRALDDSMKMFESKLEKLEGMMKTEMGRELARERMLRLGKFKEWWVEEQETASRNLQKL
jgi:uncharacterized protein